MLTSSSSPEDVDPSLGESIIEMHHKLFFLLSFSTAYSMALFFLLGVTFLSQGMSADWVAVAAAFAALTDIYVNVGVGHYSDKMQSHMGKRKPFLVLSVIFFVIGSVFAIVGLNVATGAKGAVYTLAVVFGQAGSSAQRTPRDAWYLGTYWIILCSITKMSH